jgi:hypothetical protein
MWAHDTVCIVAPAQIRKMLVSERQRMPSLSSDPEVAVAIPVNVEIKPRVNVGQPLGEHDMFHW